MLQRTYHIHISGLVQGVGFRPHVCRLAEEMNLKGWVSNTNNGVHISINATEGEAHLFLNEIVSKAPSNAIITGYHIDLTDDVVFPAFSIVESSNEDAPDLLLTPDIAICEHCRKEIRDAGNRRHGYAFTTCLNCGPRYSIIKALPYDRENTTMADLPSCDTCSAEYHNIRNRRHYSQTNSCKDCAISMHLYYSADNEWKGTDEELLNQLAEEIRKGNIAAVKGVGGYLLMADACNASSIKSLRQRKHRPEKPFALLYPSIELLEKDVLLREPEKEALQSKVAPIVLCKLKPKTHTGICTDTIAPGLDKIGVMLPYSPLLSLLADKLATPLIATSANISGSPIIYKDEDALSELFDVADIILSYDREIVAPQDDSVIQFTESGQKIILRRSRGLAPNYFPNPFTASEENILAMGAELKSAFALLQKNNLYISQYLGDQGSFESQECYQHTLQHLSDLLEAEPKLILLDKHPGYYVSHYGKELAQEKNAEAVYEVQHHKAHFAAVLAENNLLKSEEPVLGFAWDGTGYGDDKQIWGGEIFIYADQQFDRVAHLDYFPQLLGDKMSKEPRLSALSLLRNYPKKQSLIQKYFSEAEWNFYQKALHADQPVFTSSFGRFLDGLACILGIRTFNTYEGEAAMQLEALARKAPTDVEGYYKFALKGTVLHYDEFLQEFMEEVICHRQPELICRKIFNSMAKLLEDTSAHFCIDKMALSGGVFQNALLLDILQQRLSATKQLYFHQQLSPNDECIGFGQLAYYQVMKDKIKHQHKMKQDLLPV